LRQKGTDFFKGELGWRKKRQRKGIRKKGGVIGIGTGSGIWIGKERRIGRERRIASGIGMLISIGIEIMIATAENQKNTARAGTVGTGAQIRKVGLAIRGQGRGQEALPKRANVGSLPKMDQVP
jgi:hypothetical protein